ncbi:MAG: universal stress protein [Sandaracinus sp.]|nr:universal stress protein [Sandaracinus sp.]MCB9632672.1 universal stress protein [Sandaracinus sp.]
MMASRAEALAENLPSPTLVVPMGARSFVKDGVVKLSKVLIPAGDAACAKASCEALGRLLHRSSLPPGEVVLLRVGGDDAMPTLPLPEGWTCRLKHAQGSIPEAITGAAADADLIVMATHGQDSIFDAFVGTNTERVFHAAPCPVLAVPLV